MLENSLNAASLLLFLQLHLINEKAPVQYYILGISQIPATAQPLWNLWFGNHLYEDGITKM